MGRLPLGTPIIAMSLVDGTPLLERSRISDTVQKAAAAALQHIHDAGVVHGDLRRANLLLLKRPSRHSSSSSGTDTPMLGTGPGGSDSPSSDAACVGDVGSGEAGQRVVIVDLGCAQLNASRQEQDAEMRYLQRLLR